MVMTEISLYVLLGHLLIAAVGSACVPDQCQKCNVTGEMKDFWVSINSTGSDVDEGDVITLTCVHNIPYFNLTFVWTRDGKEILAGQNKSKLVLEKVLSRDAGQYVCIVISPCGNYTSSPHNVTVNNGAILLLVLCGVSAVALVVILGLAMKFKLKRDNAKHKERMKQRAQADKSGGPAPFTPRES